MTEVIFPENQPKKTLSSLHHPLSVMLIDDQAIVAEAIRSMLVDQRDIVFHRCIDPAQTIQSVHEFRPTVILLDLAMPQYDGMHIMKELRANPATRDIPLIVLSSQEDPQIKARAFETGANDYLIKLPDRVEMIARIRYHSSAYIRLLERNQAYKKLEENQRVLNAELSEAAAYVKFLLPKPLDGIVKTAWRYFPSTQLGGDGFGYQWLDKERLAFYLLDVCGHGVGAALLSISVMNVMRSQSMNVDFLHPDHVLSVLNETFPMEEHNDMFFTMWYGVYNASKRELKFSSGGHPPAILAYSKGSGPKKVTELRTDGPVIGASPISHYLCGSCEIPRGARLYLFSDGLYEIAKSDGNVLQLDEFVQEIAKPSQKGVEEIDRILGFSRSLIKGRPFTDDVSVLELYFKS